MVVMCAQTATTASGYMYRPNALSAECVPPCDGPSCDGQAQAEAAQAAQLRELNKRTLPRALKVRPHRVIMSSGDVSNISNRFRVPSLPRRCTVREVHLP